MKYILVNILLNFIKKERKDMSNHKLMDKYNPKEFEENLYNEWEKKGYFKPSMDKRKESFV